MGKILRIALLFVFTVLYANVWAQGTETTVTGTVSDKQGNTLPGVTVTVKDARISTQTNVDGKYSVRVPATAKVLVFSFIGMTTQEVNIDGRTVVNLTFESSSTALADVVKIGFGSQKRRDVNGAISSVTAAQIADIPQPSIDQMLQGKAAGVTVTQNSGGPGSSTSVHIRGITAFGASEPLYVIDGVERQGNAPTALLTRPGGGQEETSVSPLSSINPNDIESVDILKDASATAIYGSRGANGVVIITTKRGKNGTARVNYDGFVGVQQQGKFLDVMDLPQYAALQNRLAVAFGIQPRGEFADPSILGPGTNWQDAIFRRAVMHSHNIAVSGANNGTDYYVSGGYFKQDGTILGSDFNRYTFRASINSQAKSWLKFGSSFGATRSNQNVGLGSNTGIVYNALLASPDQAVYNADGSYAGPQESANGTRLGGVNPVQQALSISNTLNQNNINGSLNAEINIFKDLSLRSEVSGDFNWTNGQTFNPSYSYGAAGSQNPIRNDNASLTRLITNSTYWSWKEYFNYGHVWGKHNLTALAGREVWQSSYDNVTLAGSGFVAGNDVRTINLANTLASSIPEEKASQVMESYLARVIYTYNNKYSITANIRSDKSSNFAPGKQTGYFPGVSVSWRLSDESFMSGIKSFADNIKIRAGYGAVGNSNVPNYVYGASLRSTATAFGTGFIIRNVANPNLTWQSALQKNIGIDFSLLNNRIDGAIDAYDKTSKKFLFLQPLPYFLLGGPNEYGDNPAGISPPYINAGEIQNKGIELSVNSRNIVGKNFKWSTNFNISHYQNKVRSLNGAPEINQSITTSFISLAATKTVVGLPVGEFYGFKVKGVIKNQQDLQYAATHPQNVTGTTPQVVTNDPAQSNSIYLGDLQYQDVNGDGKIDVNDRAPLGNPNPKFTYGLTNTFNYKDFDLSVFLYGSYGGKILNVLSYQTAGLSGLYTNQLASSSNYWTPQNANSDIPAPRGGIANPNLVMSDRFLESASYLRIQNVRLGYNLPARYAKYVKLTNLKVYVSAQNLYVFTNYSGLDPEVGSFNQNPTIMNVDLGRYPVPRTITFGLNAQF
ncbi:TonB-dependent receptor [Mucilaginibacter galii]|uniref:SusC/RagA family TonB-linked outer membrane protein n=1 Tax=Mucilaginibacter galii TaxID=2005073 RepID=A0A917N1H3_9SPHI|nr:TonB-dependent receptor [Mucilaginibacter galii]GGI48997.1 SusC/RagA family TonB-linked outer membrane protein [Mucilaginibacter galii]